MRQAPGVSWLLVYFSFEAILERRLPCLLSSRASIFESEAIDPLEVFLNSKQAINLPLLASNPICVHLPIAKNL